MADFFKLTLINCLLKNGDAHLKNIGVSYQSLAQYRLGQPLAGQRRLAPIFDIVSTVPYIKNDTMALSLTGSKRWPKWKVLVQFGKQHCGLSASKVSQIAAQVQQAVQQTLPLLNALAQQHRDFVPVAEVMRELLLSQAMPEARG